MTRKDYVLIASSFARVLERESEQDRLNNKHGVHTTYAGGVRLSIREMAYALASDNPKFDYVRFFEACGAPEMKK